MLGSVHDAEDALQDALLRAWRGLPRFEARSSLRAWLYRIATNASLDLIARRPKRVLPVDHGPAADPHDSLDPPSEPLVETVWLEPYPDEQIRLEDGYASPEARYEQRESVELAFVAALQHLPPNQRAVLILREVLGFSAREVAESLDTTTASVNSALQRARAVVEDRIPAQSQQATLRALGDDQLRELVEEYSRALEDGDVDGVLSLITDDATWSMPPLPNWYRGHEAIAGFLRKGPNTVKWRRASAHANGQVAVAGYVLDEEEGTYGAFVIDVLTLRGDGKISEVTAFLDRTIFARFGLPDELPGQL
jgi:RNA polymerase sigma-70 factor (ECF subfamily)